jgi:hypothetical protein
LRIALAFHKCNQTPGPSSTVVTLAASPFGKE